LLTLDVDIWALDGAGSWTSPVGGDPVAVLAGIARQETFTELAAALQDGTVVEHPDVRDRVGLETPGGLGARVMVVRWGDRGWMVESFSHRVPCS
jgi:hypothetical protein